MNEEIEQKISKVSAELYIKKANGLIARANKEYKLTEADKLTTDQIIEFMIANRKRWRYSTWKLYRCSIIFYAEKTNNFDAETLKQSFQGYEPKETREINNNSKRKAKHISDNDFQAMIDFLENKKARTNLPDITVLYLKASIAAGPRPGEWESAILDGNELTLRNFKKSDIRAHGEFRTLIYPPESQQLDDVKKFIQALKDYISENADKDSDDPDKSEMDLFKKIMESIRQQIKDANNHLFPKRKFSICRYTLRHQFCADLKATGKTAAEVAALMGHKSVLTAFSHYGKKSKGVSNRVTANASPTEVQKVTALNASSPKTAPTASIADLSPATPSAGENPATPPSPTPEAPIQSAAIKLPKDLENRLKNLETTIKKSKQESVPKGPEM